MFFSAVALYILPQGYNPSVCDRWFLRKYLTVPRKGQRSVIGELAMPQKLRSNAGLFQSRTSGRDTYCNTSRNNVPAKNRWHKNSATSHATTHLSRRYWVKIHSVTRHTTILLPRRSQTIFMVWRITEQKCNASHNNTPVTVFYDYEYNKEFHITFPSSQDKLIWHRREVINDKKLFYNKIKRLK